MSITLDWTISPSCDVKKNLNYVLTVATLIARNANEAMVAPMVGSDGVCFWLESGGRFCVGAFGRNLASVAMKMFAHLIYFKRNVIDVLSMRFAKITLQ
jgi:hypothetical protein